jgi:alpha-beta hydrolase superfamily lysophospholipase
MARREASIETFVEQLAAKIATIRAATGATKSVVAHSMGGLIVRAYMRRYGARTCDVSLRSARRTMAAFMRGSFPASASRRYGRAARGSPSSIATGARDRRCARRVALVVA